MSFSIAAKDSGSSSRAFSDEPRITGTVSPGYSRPDLFNVLDASAAPAPGIRRGFTTAKNLSLQAQQSGINLGPIVQEMRNYWETISTLTLDMCIVQPNAGWDKSVSLLGCGESATIAYARPFTLSTHPERPGWLLFGIADDRASGEYDLANAGISFEIPSTKILHISIQIDLQNGLAAVWVNGVKPKQVVDVTPGHTFRANIVWPWHLGRSGYRGALGTPPATITLAGYHLTTELRYRWTEELGRADGGVINDLWRYFDRTNQETTIGFIPFDDPLEQRWLSFENGNGIRDCILIKALTEGGGQPNRLADLSIWGYGPSVVLGAVLNWRGDNLNLSSSSSMALCSAPTVISYPVILSNCIFSGHDAAISVGPMILHLDNPTIISQGRDGIRLFGSYATIRNLFSSFVNERSRSVLRYIPGGTGDLNITIDGAILDHENCGVSEALFVVTGDPYYAVTLRLKDVYTAKSGPNPNGVGPLMKLQGNGQAIVENVVGRFTEIHNTNTKWTVNNSSPAAAIVNQT
jgi:hypothetical protein